MTEVGLAAALLLVLAIVIAAEPAIVLLAGEEFREAGPVLRIQAVALIAVFLGQVWQLGLVSLRRQASLVAANGAALVVVVALGIVLIRSHGAIGAAVAAVVGEAVLAVAVLAFLARARRSVVPSFGLVPRIAAAGALASVAVFLPLPALAGVGLAAGIFLAAGWALRAIPPELRAAFRRGAAL
jgi:O-antigen/teichoic acid export membrane protein